MTVTRQALAVWLMIQARVEVMHRTEPTFEVLPKRWVVERNACMVQPLSSSQQGL
jgi:hypothetical protein